MSEEYKRAGVLFSAGLDSAVLAADALSRGPVRPIYVSVGFAWEAEERDTAARVLAAAPFAGRIDPLVTLTFDMRDVFPSSHWAVRGEPPAFDTPDEDVYIHGRNVILASKAAVYLSREKIERLLLGTLAGNPFPDATPAFFDAMSRALTLGTGAPIAIDAPFAAMHKSEVIRKGIALGVPLELTLSCMQPREGRHCGQCSKCRERRDAFADARVEDPTRYRTPPRR
jgi:7-cyano-7-deazaguanine synthase